MALAFAALVGWLWPRAGGRAPAGEDAA
jgi:hypothetical protein